MPLAPLKEVREVNVYAWACAADAVRALRRIKAASLKRWVHLVRLEVACAMLTGSIMGKTFFLDARHVQAPDN